MLTLEDLDAEQLHLLFDDYTLDGASAFVREMQALERSDQYLSALVGHEQLHQVEIHVQGNSIAYRCDCHYDFGGPCPHVVALLTRWATEPGAFAAPDLPLPADEYPIEVTPVGPPPTRQPERPPFWMRANFQDRRQFDDQQLDQQLHGLVMRDLRAIARQRGWKIKAGRKDDLVRQIVARLSDPSETRQAVHELKREQRQTLYALALLGRETGAKIENLEQIAGLWGELGRPGQIEVYTSRLHELGLVLPRDIEENVFYRSDFVPASVARNLGPILKDALPSVQPVGEQLLGQPYDLVRAANQVVMLLEQDPSPLRPPLPRPRLEQRFRGLAGWDYEAHELAQAMQNQQFGRYSDLVLSVPPPARSLPDETIARLLPVAGDEARLEFMYSLLVAAGVFQPGSPVTVCTDVKMRFLQQDELVQRAILARAYFFALNWSALWEVLRDPPTARTNPLVLKRLWNHHHVGLEHLYMDLYRFRHTVLRALACVPDGQWVALEDLLRLLRLLWPRFDHTVWREYWRSNPVASWYLAKSGSKRPLRPDNEEHWCMAQGNFVRATLNGPLHWLGLADLCFDDGELRAVRFNGLADLYWERAESAPVPPHAAQEQAIAPQDAVQIEGRTIYTRPAHVSSQAHALLDKIALLDTVEPERFAYQLAPQAVYEAFEAGATLPEILDDWEKLIPVPLPEDLRAQLSAWWEAFGRVRIYQDLTVIEFGDDYALAEMLATTSLGERLIAKLSSRLVVVHQQAVAPLMAELEKAGYTPKHTEQI